ncbi:MAG: VPLPA-CTERM sorting domain-containing protein [Boseongicola sp.]
MRPVTRRSPACRIFALAAAFAVCQFSGGIAVRADTVLPIFSMENFAPGTVIDNQYFPLGEDYRATIHAEGVDDEGEEFEEESQLSFGGPGREILGVQTTTQLDEAFEDGVIVERTFDYYAQDIFGNVWYMGEDVTNFIYDDDVLIETNDDSAWIAGENGALPGYIMPAAIDIGFAYYQEFAAADEALDEAEIYGLGLTLEIGESIFENVLQILETTLLDPEAREFKYYAPGVGLIRVEEDLDENYENPGLVFNIVKPAVIPLPSAFGLLFGSLLVLGTIRRRKLH